MSFMLERFWGARLSLLTRARPEGRALRGAYVLLSMPPVLQWGHGSKQSH